MVLMRATVLLIPLVAMGCNRVANAFEVQGAGAVSAELTLCGQSTELKQTGEKFAGSISIRCEGDGVIKVRFPNQQTVNCAIGYVTPGAVQSFKFKVENGRCGSTPKISHALDGTYDGITRRAKGVCWHFQYPRVTVARP